MGLEEVKNIYNLPSLTSSSKTGAHFICDGKPQSAENTGIIHEAPWEEGENGI